MIKAWRLINSAPNFRDTFIDRIIKTPFPRIDFKNGASWFARSTARKGEYLEGWDFDYASYDECAFDPYFDHIIDEVLSLRLLDRGGQIDCISTGKRGSAFNRRFESQSEYLYKQQGRTTDNPNLDQVALKRLIDTLDAGLLEERIYGGIRPLDGRIPHASIMRAIAQAEGLSPAYINSRYSTGWDLAKNKNFVVGVTLDISVTPYQLVAWERFNQSTVSCPNEISFWEYVWGRILARWQIYNGLTFVDTTGIGSAIADYLYQIGGVAMQFSGSKVQELIGLLEISLGLGVLGFPPLEDTNPNGTQWSLTNELEEVADELKGLDTATAIALALWGVRQQLQGKIIIPIAPKVVGFRQKSRVA